MGVQFVLFNMKKLIKYLISSCLDYNLDHEKNRVEFIFNEYTICCYLFSPEIILDVQHIDPGHTIDKVLSSLSINQISKIKFIYYGDPVFSEDNDLSLYNKYYDIKRKFIKRIPFENNSSVIIKPCFDQCYMCPGPDTYGIEIEICDKKLFDQYYFQEIVNIISKGRKKYIPDFYLSQDNNYNSNKDCNIKILNTNTKVRRLGYFKILALFFNQYHKVPVRFINKKFEIFVQKFNDDLHHHINDKGLIKVSKNGVSAKPYIDFASDISFINSLNNLFLPSKSFKVYLVLIKNYMSTGNIFSLSKLDKLFFLENILRYDYLYIYNP